MKETKQASREQGKAIMRQILGDAAVDKMERDIADGVLGIFPADHSIESCFTTIWGRPGLDMRSRSIATIGMVIAVGIPYQLKTMSGAG
jgi:4-carboxymuconolactone decarboxylase